MRNPGRRIGLSVAAVTVAAAGIVTAVVATSGSTDGGSAAGDAGGTGSSAAVDITLHAEQGSCGSLWSAPHGGALSVEVDNSAGSPGDFYLENPDSRGVLLEFEGIGAGASARATVTLGNGTYRFVCFIEDGNTLVGPSTTITDAATVTGTTPAIVPVSKNDLVPVSLAYQKWVGTQLPTLKADVARLAADIHRDDLAAARRDWLTAHLFYETLGAAYDAFGDVDGEINGAPASGVDPVTDKDLTGFHKIEALLWSGAPAGAIAPVVSDLGDAVDELITTVGTLRFEPNDIALRAHEIVENAIEFELNGTTDAGSHTNLATVEANLTGAAKALGFVEPLLRPRYPRLPETEQALADSQRLIGSFDHGGSWPSLDSLSRTDRERVNASLGNTVELLAPVAAICDVRQEVPQ